MLSLPPGAILGLQGQATAPDFYGRTSIFILDVGEQMVVAYSKIG
jgi:hypothetical protein